MEELCCQLSENVSTLVGFLDKEGRPLRSFQRDAPATTLPPDAPEEVKRARQVIIDASMRLHQLALGPSEYLPNLATGVQTARDHSQKFVDRMAD